MAAATFALGATGLPSYSATTPAGATAHSPLAGSMRAQTLCGSCTRTPVTLRSAVSNVRSMRPNCTPKFGTDVIGTSPTICATVPCV